MALLAVVDVVAELDPLAFESCGLLVQLAEFVVFDCVYEFEVELDFVDVLQNLVSLLALVVLDLLLQLLLLDLKRVDFVLPLLQLLEQLSFLLLELVLLVYFLDYLC